MSNNITIDNQHQLSPLITIIKQLAGIISEEIILLKSRRPKELEKLMPAKNELLITYHKEMADLNNRGGLQAIGSASSLRVLKKESRIFQSVLVQHQRILKTLKNISENMIKAISDEVIKSQNQASRYGANGIKNSNRSPTSISLNQTI